MISLTKSGRNQKSLHS